MTKRIVWTKETRHQVLHAFIEEIRINHSSIPPEGLTSARLAHIITNAQEKLFKEKPNFNTRDFLKTTKGYYTIYYSFVSNYYSEIQNIIKIQSSLSEENTKSLSNIAKRFEVVLPVVNKITDAMEVKPGAPTDIPERTPEERLKRAEKGLKRLVTCVFDELRELQTRLDVVEQQNARYAKQLFDIEDFMSRPAPELRPAAAPENNPISPTALLSALTSFLAKPEVSASSVPEISALPPVPVEPVRTVTSVPVLKVYVYGLMAKQQQDITRRFNNIQFEFGDTKFNRSSLNSIDYAIGMTKFMPHSTEDLIRSVIGEGRYIRCPGSVSALTRTIQDLLGTQ